ncbi:hypothetical protein LshimejAT787_0210220 [Lyophyllum shimeji]|uniref:Uncharacterized protein n=1 Tax=Lyophyllum shimeji TaxID=47721 RepID=A0A9P3UJH3_LYOSH|nr:hypothetical protein LshimejAT787_0210220 [Lyophyllum shimeji]
MTRNTTLEVDGLGNQTVEEFPFLTLFGYDESRRKAIGFSATNGHSKTYQVVRYFGSIQGFHTGSLDLTGRLSHRGEALMKRWNHYLADLIALTLHARESDTDKRALDGRPTADYAFDDVTLWRIFHKKWGIPPFYCYGLLLPLTQSTRLLASTCRYLNDIGRRHTHRKRSITFELPQVVFSELGRAENKAEYPKNLATSSHDKVLSKTTFLLRRHDLTPGIKEHSIHDMWAQRILPAELTEDGPIAN